MASTPQTVSAWHDAAREKLSELARLSENWDGYGSPPLRAAALATALDLLQGIDGHELPMPDICPVTAGGIAIIWRAATRRLEIEVLADGSLEYLTLTLRAGRGEEVGHEGSLALDRKNEAQPLIQRLIDWLIQG